MIFFTADTHFGHKNIIWHCLRPYDESGVEQMNFDLIARWNERVAKTDTVYHLGDFALCRPEILHEVLDQLHGDIYLIEGNHEKTAKSAKCRDRFGWIKPYHELKVQDQLIILQHYPMITWNKLTYGSWHLHGHSHGSLPSASDKKRLDVGVDTHDLYPYSLAEISTLMRAKDKSAASPPRDYVSILEDARKMLFPYESTESFKEKMKALKKLHPELFQNDE